MKCCSPLIGFCGLDSFVWVESVKAVQETQQPGNEVSMLPARTDGRLTMVCTGDSDYPRVQPEAFTRSLWAWEMDMSQDLGENQAQIWSFLCVNIWDEKSQRLLVSTSLPSLAPSLLFALKS